MGGGETIRKAIGLALANTRALMTLTREVTLPADSDPSGAGGFRA